jgi:hypothetical protein
LPWKFDAVPAGFWADKGNQRWFFDWFAAENGLDILEKWYSVTAKVLWSSISRA